MGENNLNDTIVERVGEIRELNNHENQLIDNRFTWMLIIEGLLINAYVTLFRDVAHCPVKFVELIILLLLCGIGIFVTICFFNTFQTARRSMKNLKKRYKELIQKMDMTDSCLYPIAAGKELGLKEEREQGLQEGRQQGISETARKMKAMDLPTDTICAATGLSAVEIGNL